MLLTCRICGKSYDGNVQSSTVCPECAAEARKTTIRPRVCRECGQTFSGGPRAWYCPECRAERKKEQKHRYQTAGAVRPIGSTDVCVRCGKEYTVSNGLQKYCPDCAVEAVRAVVAAHKREYNRAVDVPRRRIRREQARIPAHGLRNTLSVTELLDNARNVLHLSQRDVATICRADPSAVCRWYSGDQHPSLKQVSRLLRFANNFDAAIPPSKILKLRRHLALTQSEFAAYMGVSANTVAYWEHGEFAPRGANAQKLLRLAETPAEFGVPPVFHRHQIASLRNRLGIDKDAFAVLLDTDAATVIKLEAGSIRANLEQRKKIASLQDFAPPLRRRSETQTDLIGKRFGKLTVIAKAAPYVSPSGTKLPQWLCKCDCGNETIVHQYPLLHGKTRSCGCLRKERTREKKE
nr:MAG TPA: putative transcriptional regulator [Caudoviricetes sp.]